MTDNKVEFNVDEFTTREGALTATDEQIAVAVGAIRESETLSKEERKKALRLAAYATAAHFRLHPQAEVAATAREWKLNRATLIKQSHIGAAVVHGGIDEGTDEFKALERVPNRFPLAGVLDGKGRDNKGERFSVPVTREDVMWALGVLFPDGITKNDGKSVGDIADEEAVNKALGIEVVKTPEEKAQEHADLVDTVKKSFLFLTGSLNLITDAELGSMLDAVEQFSVAFGTRTVKVKDADVALLWDEASTRANLAVRKSQERQRPATKKAAGKRAA